jgi:hypothetical protein
MTNQFDFNKFNTLMSQAADSILCNSECQTQRQSEKLKQTYLNTQTNLATAPNKEQIAEKNYIVFTQGETAYNNLLNDKLNEKAQLIVDKFTETFNEESVKIKSQIQTYNGILINFRNIVELLNNYKIENKELKQQLKDDTNDVLTNERKTFYEDQNIGSLDSFYFYVILIIYVIVVGLFGVFSLLYPSQISWKVRFAMFIGFIALPFFSTWILGTLIYLIYEIYNLLPKNVYVQKNF